MQVITANRLIDGLVVFRTETGGWVTGFADAHVFAAQAELDAALAAAQADVDACRVIDPYAVAVDSQSGRLRPKSLRERIRAEGPTVPSDFSAAAPRSAAA